MARSKTSLDWFKLDTAADDKFDAIEAAFGLKGFAVVVKLYRKIYGGFGYYCEWTESVRNVFAARECCAASTTLVDEILAAAIKEGIFDRNLFDKYRIITSHGVQSRYFEAIGRRGQVEVIADYLLVDYAHLPQNTVFKSASGDIIAENVDKMLQSREDKSREDKSRNSVCAAPLNGASPNAGCGVKLMLNDGSTYEPLQSDVDTWQGLYPAVDVMQQIRSMAGWCTGNPKNRKTKSGIKRFITGWLNREQNKARKLVDAGQTLGKPNPALAYTQRSYSQTELASMYTDIMSDDNGGGV